MNTQKIEGFLEDCPIIAILRGLTSENAIQVVTALYEAGIKVVEVPLNSPNPFLTISILCEEFGEKMMIGAGTVLSLKEVEQLKEIGGHFIVSPNTDVEIIKRTLELGMFSFPGVATPSEAFSAVKAGAKYLKLFPAKALGAATVSALKDVLPSGVHLFAVGGVNENTINGWLNSGCSGVGTGSGLFTKDMTIEQISENARLLVSTCRSRS